VSPGVREVALPTLGVRKSSSIIRGSTAAVAEWTTAAATGAVGAHSADRRAPGTITVVDVLTRIGLVELAFGAVLGWAVAATVITPALVERAGVRTPRRVLQAHLDYVIMGIILIAVGLAVPGLPTWLLVALVVGTWVNRTLFVPLAFSPRGRGSR
jgi:hypothetical protein